MANLPNTTQVPNVIFNGLMREMTDTDLRIVLCVVRATLGWIEARDENGTILDTKVKRRGQKIYYRIGKAIILTTSENSSEVVVSLEKTSNEKTSIEESSRYKRNPPTKETLNKTNLKDSWTKELLKKLEEAYGGTLTKSQLGRQARALGELKDANYTPEDIWQGIERMRQDNWWKSKNPDFRNLADNTLKFLTNKQKVVDKYSHLVNKD